MAYLIRDVVSYLESLAPPAYQEDYDNAQLLVGDPGQEVSGVLCSLDVTEEVVREAVEKNCNLIVAHHPIIFRGLKSLTGKTYVERTIVDAIRQNVAIYAIHTNLDHVIGGVNAQICKEIGLENTRILAPKSRVLSKLVAFVPSQDTKRVTQALFEAGAGQIGEYANCSFRVNGTGTFLPSEKANPTIGARGELQEEQEDRVEIMFPSHLSGRLIHALKKSHPYEEVAYYLQTIENENQEVGAGMIGDLPEEMDGAAFLARLKTKMNLHMVKHTAIPKNKLKKIAVCGGAGIFLLGAAKKAGADVFVTSDVKYHEFFDADNQIVIADIGHYESEFFTKELLRNKLSQNFSNIALYLSNVVTNPISYL